MNTLIQKLERGKNLLPWLIFILIFALYLPAMFLMDIPSRDVALRYAPAADAFAQGDWLNAFHPRFQMLHQLFSGIFTFLFRTDGFTGTKLSSLFFYALGVFPFFALMREVFTEKIANFSLLFYLFASRLLILGYEGLRESHKMLVILLLALGMIHIVKQSERLKGYMITGIAAGLAVCTRNDMILFSVCILVFCGILDSYRNSISWRSLVMFLFAGISAMPEFLVNYWMTGYFIPGARFYFYFKEILHAEPVLSEVLLKLFPALLTAGVGFCNGIGVLLKRQSGKYIFTALVLAAAALYIYNMVQRGILVQKIEYFEFFEAVFRGLFPLYFIFTLPGLLYRIIRKKMTVCEWTLAGIYFLHGSVIIFQIFTTNRYLYVSARYLLPAAPLYFGWLVFSWGLLRRMIGKIPKISDGKKWISAILLFMFFAGAFADSYSKAVKLYTKGGDKRKRDQVLAIAEIIRKDYRGPRKSEPKHSLIIYNSGKRPGIIFGREQKLSVAAYFIGGSFCPEIRKADYAVYPENWPVPARYGFKKLGAPLPGKHSNEKMQIWKRK